jgi:hypothetical protein
MQKSQGMRNEGLKRFESNPMSVEPWRLWTLGLFVGYPAVVMLVWSIVRALQAKSPLALLRLTVASLAFTPLVTLFWVIAWIPIVALVLGLLSLFGSNQLMDTVAIFGLMLVGVLVGTPIGWRYLNREMPFNVRDFRF